MLDIWLSALFAKLLDRFVNKLKRYPTKQKDWLVFSRERQSNFKLTSSKLLSRNLIIQLAKYCAKGTFILSVPIINIPSRLLCVKDNSIIFYILVKVIYCSIL